jgi:chromosome segregation ATPase
LIEEVEEAKEEPANAD